jgi:hypothetical protein
MNKTYIYALGQLLYSYETDLIFMKSFKDYKKDRNKEIAFFKNFVNEYKVARNVDKDQSYRLIDITLNWIQKEDSLDVDGFARHLQKDGITRNQLTTSLASKILLLNNPYKIFPIDNLARKAVNLKSNVYADYIKLVKEYKKQHLPEIEKHLNSVDRHLKIIEKDYSEYFKDIETIRMNRFIDKILWSLGSK